MTMGLESTEILHNMHISKDLTRPNINVLTDPNLQQKQLKNQIQIITKIKVDHLLSYKNLMSNSLELISGHTDSIQKKVRF